MKALQESSKQHFELLEHAQKAFRENSAARAAVGEHIAALSDQVKEIERAMKEVQNISMQVKILSLNASVEAARAGAAGKGFSVVAQEVGNLARSTDQSVSNIEESIRKVQKLLVDTERDMDNAKKIGGEFAQSLDACVESAGALQNTVLQTIETAAAPPITEP